MKISYIITLWHTIQVFDKFFWFISWAQNLLRKKFKEYYNHKDQKFENKVLENWFWYRKVFWELNAFYTLPQNKEKERYHYIFISYIQLIISSIILLKSVYRKILKTMTYLKNLYASEKEISLIKEQIKKSQTFSTDKLFVQELRLIYSTNWGKCLLTKLFKRYLGVINITILTKSNIFLLKTCKKP